MRKITGIILTIFLSCAAFVSAQVTIIGATEASTGAINKSYTTLKDAFTAINGNASGLATDNIIMQISANTTEITAPTTLNAPKGISATTVTAGATTYKFPIITLTGGTNTAPGTFIVTIYNGKIQSIANTGGAWSVVPTVNIEGSGGASNLNVTTRATAFCTGTNLTFNITEAGAGYGPKTSVTATVTGAGSGAAIGYALISGATATAPTTVNAGLYTISPSAVAVSTNSYVDYAGSGYTGGATAPLTNTDGGTYASGTAATASSTITIANANYASVLIYPTTGGLTISATNSGNQPFLVLNGAKNVTIDGRVHDISGAVTGTAPDLTIQYATTNASTNSASTIYLNAGANHNTITYCKLKSVTQNGNTRGTLAIGTAALTRDAISSSVGGSYNTISYNQFSPYYTGSETYKGNGGMLTSACSNDDLPNTNNVFDNNTFDNYFINGPIANISAAISIQGNPNPNKPTNVNCSITNNSFFHSTDGATTANAARTFIKLGNSTNYAGYGHVISGNFMGGKAVGCTGGMLTKIGAFADNLTGIYVSSSYGATTITNNFMKNISATNGGGAVSNTTRFIDVNGYGSVNITNNTMGDNATGSIVIDNLAVTGPSNLHGIYLNTTSDVSCTNNTIGSITVNTNPLTNFGGIWKSATAGNCTISNNTIGNASMANSILNNSASTQYVYPIYSAGTANINVSSNTIANITNNTTTGALYGIFHESGANAFNANANLIHSLNVTSTSTAAKVVGIYCASGTNSITNNIVKLNGDNAATIYGLDEEETATASSFYHNTVYLSGAPTTAALNSACIASNGSTNMRDIRNNIFVNARTNNGATGIHYSLLMPAATGTIAVNANDYQATGASGAMLGNYGGVDVSSGSVIVTGQDADSQNADPGFVSAGGILAANYVTSTTLNGVSVGVTTDFSGTTRAAIQMGAWNKSGATAVDNIVENDGIIVTRKNNQLIISCTNDLKSNASVSVYNLIGRKLASTQLIDTTTILNNRFQSGIYLVSILNGGKTTTKKIVLN